MIPLITGLLVACMPTVEPDSNPNPQHTGDTATEISGESLGVISTIANDYSVGAIATVDLSSLAIQDTLAPTSGDTVVRALDTEIAVLNRLNTDTLRIYTPGQWDAPDLEVALPDLANPQDAKNCGGNTWVSLHNDTQLVAFDPHGRQVATADLSPWAGTDGAAEPASMTVVDGALLVAVQEIAQDDAWSADGGVIVRVDCTTSEVEVLVTASPSPVLVGGTSPNTLGIKTGLYGSLDGSVLLYDMTTGQQEILITEAELSADITAASIRGSEMVFLTADTDWNYSIHCMDISSGSLVTAATLSTFLADVAIDEYGRAWISAREGWSSESPSEPGLWLMEASTCELLNETPLHTTLPPYNVAFL
ncbi:MAG: hypothetical protein VX519_01710 [Myxococcota bacterium]|nr:hypothetical protein [Myxococcota bacterium]